MTPAQAVMLLQAVPTMLSSLGSLFGRRQQQMPQAQPTITWDEALRMAEAQMNPLAQQYDRQAMQRGFYGQMPNDLMRSDYLASQQAGMAQQMMQQDWQNKFNQQQAAADWSLKQGSLNLGQQQLNMQKQQNVGNALQTAQSIWPIAWQNTFGKTDALPNPKAMDDVLGNTPLGNGNPWTLQSDYGAGYYSPYGR